MSPTNNPILRIGTRGSSLALWQARWVAEQLHSRSITTEICIIQTAGDMVQNQSIVNIGAPGVFTKEIQRALLDKEVDLAVHSLKDLPTESVSGLTLVAVPRRASYRDAFVSPIACTMEDLPKGSLIGTGSVRRKSQILYHFGNQYRVENIRGNVETRLRKLEAGEYDALVLAESGLVRLGLADSIRSLLDVPFFLPAVGQGALGLEIREEDRQTMELLLPINDEATWAAVLAERSMLRTLQGGCSAPIAALGTVKDSTLTLHGRIFSIDGKKMAEDVQSVHLAKTDTADFPAMLIPEQLGCSVAETLRKKIEAE